MVLAQFGLTVDPFRITPDVRFVYPHPAFDRSLTAIESHVLGRRGMLLLLGESGTGKTVLIQQLKARLQTQGCLVFDHAYPEPSFDEWLSVLCETAKVPGSAGDRKAAIGGLAEMLINRFAQGGTAVVLIDEAHALSDEVLREMPALAGLRMGDRRLIQFVLSSGPALERRFRGPEAVRRFGEPTCVRLSPLAETDIASYIAHRLFVAGHAGDAPFSPAAIGRIAEWSRGVPALINRLCNTALVLGSIESLKVIPGEIIDQAAEQCALEPPPGTAPRRAAAPAGSPASEPMTAEILTDAPWPEEFESLDRHLPVTVAASEDSRDFLAPRIVAPLRHPVLKPVPRVVDVGRSHLSRPPAGSRGTWLLWGVPTLLAGAFAAGVMFSVWMGPNAGAHPAAGRPEADRAGIDNDRPTLFPPADSQSSIAALPSATSDRQAAVLAGPLAAELRFRAPVAAAPALGADGRDGWIVPPAPFVEAELPLPETLDDAGTGGAPAATGRSGDSRLEAQRRRLVRALRAAQAQGIPTEGLEQRLHMLDRQMRGSPGRRRAADDSPPRTAPSASPWLNGNPDAQWGAMNGSPAGGGTVAVPRDLLGRGHIGTLPGTTTLNGAPDGSPSRNWVDMNAGGQPVTGFGMPGPDPGGSVGVGMPIDLIGRPGTGGNGGPRMPIDLIGRPSGDQSSIGGDGQFGALNSQIGQGPDRPRPGDLDAGTTGTAPGPGRAAIGHPR